MREQEHVILALTKLCREMGVTNLLQVGAEDGYEAYFIAEATGCSAHAIEADPKCAPFIAGLDFHRAYIGAENADKVPFYIHPISGLSSPLPRFTKNEKVRNYRMVTLDTFCANTGIKPDALIIDTEGTTLAVLKGATETLRKVKMIYAEVQNNDTKVAQFLAEQGFTFVSDSPSYTVETQSNWTWVKR